MNMKKKQQEDRFFMKDLLNDFKMSRRSFIKRTSAAAGGTIVIGGTLRLTLRALAESSETDAGGAGEWKPATCQGCTSWCSTQVYIVDGRAVLCSRCMTRIESKPQ